MKDYVVKFDIREIWRLMSPELETSLSDRISDTEILIPARLIKGAGSDYILDCFEWCINENLESILNCRVARHYCDDVWKTVYTNKSLSLRFRNLLERELCIGKITKPVYFRGDCKLTIRTLVTRTDLFISGLEYETSKR